MNWRIKDGEGELKMTRGIVFPLSVKRYHDDSHEQLGSHLGNFLDAHNFVHRLKTLSELTPYKYICKLRTSESERFALVPIHKMPGSNC